MVFAFRSQPLKTVYLVYFALSTLTIRLPYWIVTSAVPAARPRRSWSFGCALFVQFVRAMVNMQYDVGIAPPPDPRKLAAMAKEPGFVWVEPVAGDLIVGELAVAAKTNVVQPVRVSGYWLGAKDASGGHGQRASAGEHVLYSLHGGGYVSGTASPKGTWTQKTVGITAHSSGIITRAFTLEYRLASAAPFSPSNAFPSALIDALAGYRYLVHDLGFDPKHIVVEGDSAGGHLALNLVMYLIRSQFQDLPPPGGLIMLSPTVDWACTHDGKPTSSMTRNYYSDYVHTILSCGYAARALRGALSEAELASNAYLSPASLTLQNAKGFFANFPPTLIIAGEAEVTLDPMRTLGDRLIADNGADTVTYREYLDAAHDWLVVPVFKAQREAALQDIENWIASVFHK